METGIYYIINKINNKKYVGSTTESFSRRLGHHRHVLNNNTHRNRHLQNAWNKYGEDNFEFKIIEKISENILNVEQIHINKFDFNKLYNINRLATGGLQFSKETIARRTISLKKTNLERSKRYKLWKGNKIDDSSLTENELKIFNNWINHIPWNKGKKYKSTEHLKVSKKLSDRSKDKETKRNNAPEIEIYDLNNKYLITFRSSKDIKDYSTTDKNNLPINSRFKIERMNKPIKYLNSGNINKSCKTGKPYKGLIFKYKQSPFVK
jgi:group I intron endonuclease